MRYMINIINPSKFLINIIIIKYYTVLHKIIVCYISSKYMIF